LIRWAGHVANVGYIKYILNLVEKAGGKTYLGSNRHYRKKNIKTDKRYGPDTIKKEKDR
jgi:hypothetical protein